MTEEIIVKPFDWNDNLAEIALEDFSAIQQKLSYGAATTIGMALAKLEFLEKQGCKVEPPEHTEPKAFKEFKIGEKIPPEEWKKGMSVTEIIDEVRERMCKKYCKYPYEWDEETQGELSESEICASCPLNRL